MEFLIELVLDLFVEGGIEVSSNKKISKWIRYPIAITLILIFLVTILGVIFLGISILNKSLLGGIFIILVGLILLISCVLKFIKIMSDKR